MQYGEPVPQGKSNSFLEVVTFPWINVSGYNFNIMNTLHVCNVICSQPSPVFEKTCSIFQITIPGYLLKLTKSM